MNKIINNLEVEKINSQLRRADLKRIKLIKSLYKEYAYYLELVRGLLFSSVEKGVYALYSVSSTRNSPLNTNEFSFFIEKRISYFINSQLPFVTIEQLKIREMVNNIIQENNFNSSIELAEFEANQKVNLDFDDNFIFGQPLQFHLKNYTSEYYQFAVNEFCKSIDLDNNTPLNYYSNEHNIEKIGTDKGFITSVLELMEDDIYQLRDSEKSGNLESEFSFESQNLDFFNSIDNSLNNFLMNFSHKINSELFKSKIIEKIISIENFSYLVNQKFMIKHPKPFVINLDLNINKSLQIDPKLPSIFLLNITTVELEFKNLNLSIQRNKINELKNQFQLLIKKEKYWKQKEINLNKISI